MNVLLAELYFCLRTSQSNCHHMCMSGRASPKKVAAGYSLLKNIKKKKYNRSLTTVAMAGLIS